MQKGRKNGKETIKGRLKQIRKREENYTGHYCTRPAVIYTLHTHDLHDCTNYCL